MHGKVLDSIGFVNEFDAEIGSIMAKELGRQQDGLELIASENFASPAVIAASMRTAFSGLSRNSTRCCMPSVK